MFLRNIDSHTDYTALDPRRWQFSTGICGVTSQKTVLFIYSHVSVIEESQSQVFYPISFLAGWTTAKNVSYGR
jgi:hypothetical protein